MSPYMFVLSFLTSLCKVDVVLTRLAMFYGLRVFVYTLCRVDKALMLLLCFLIPLHVCSSCVDRRDGMY
ncbi:hypothetical protein V8B97DRAFT_1984716 [Scleroderma yunnanense]